MAIKLLNNHYKLKNLNPEIVWNIINKNIDENNAAYNAFISRVVNCAEASCRDSRQRYENNAPYGLLDGIPMVVKDNFCVEDAPTTCGSKMLENFRPNYTATAVKKLLQAGVLLVGKTNMDEFAMGCGSMKSSFGGVVNPWRDADGELCVTGGSSGGTAVAVASGWALAGLGSDTGGSIRLPATLTGLVGLKPTYGAVSRHGVIALMNALDTPSIMARHVDDAQIVFDAIKGRDVRDPTSLEYPAGGGGEDGDGAEDGLAALTVGVPQEFHPEGLHSDVADLWEDSAQWLAQLGCNVVKVSLPHTRLAGKCYSVLCCAEVASNMARYGGVQLGLRDNSVRDGDNFLDNLLAQSRSAGLGAAVRERILMGNFFLLQRNRADYFHQARKIWRLICHDFRAVFDRGVDVLLTPAALGDAPPVNTFTVLDDRVAMIKGDICTQPASLAGVPALALPVRLSSRGMPIGVQLIADKFNEPLLFRVGRSLEKWAGFTHRFPFVHEQALKTH